MNDQDPSANDLAAELVRLRSRIAELEASEAGAHEAAGPPGNNEEYYRPMFEANPQPMWVFDLETLAFLAVNDAAVRKYGFSREEFLAMTIADIRPPEDVPRLMKNIAGVTNGLDEAGVWRHRTRAGSVIDVEITSHTLSFEGRKAEMVLARDITDRKQAEARLQESEQKYRMLFDSATDAIVILDLKGNFIDVNRTAYTRLGYTKQEILSMNVSQLDPPEFAAIVPERLAQISRDGQAVFESAHIRKDGSMMPVEINARLLDYEGRKVYFSIIRDITDRKRAEEELQASEVRMRAVVERAPFGAHSYELRPDGSLILSGTNHAADQILGIDHSRLIGKTIEEAFPGLVGTSIPDTYRKIAAHGENHEFETVHYDQDAIHGSFEIHAFQTRPNLMTVFFRDITESKKAEEERLTLERRLLHAQKLESLGSLAGGIAHDFNNLLMAILGNLDIAMIKLPPSSAARENIEQSAQAALRAADLTRQMLAYSGRGRFIVQAMDLNELVEENANLFRSAISRAITLHLELTRPLPLIEADAGQVQQVIMNLLTNASDAIADKAGVISLATGSQACDAKYLKRSRIEYVPHAGKFVYLEVSDTGTGMDEQTQQRMFDPFFTTKTAGRGLGMSAILGIVRGHHGAIFIDSGANRGTTIRILFPAVEEKAAAGAAVSTAEAALTGPATPVGTVLVVDDEDIVRNICKEMIESFGMQALTASDGRHALEVFRQNAERISLVILDITMPVMDGITAFRELVRIRSDVKVILSSGYDEQDSLRQLSGEGLAGFIKKPYTLKDLRDAIQKVKDTDG
ncbi:MAG: PAS domain S-box protein [Nitrospirae bacterium]|nr:PAS domain S-box protein [Nitrospirota bacterium]